MNMKDWRDQNEPRGMGAVITAEAAADAEDEAKEEERKAEIEQQENLEEAVIDFKEFIGETNVFIEFTAIVLRDMSLTFFTFDDDLYNCFTLDQIKEAIEK